MESVQRAAKERGREREREKEGERRLHNTELKL